MFNKLFKKVSCLFILSCSLACNISFADITVMGNGSASVDPNIALFDIMVETSALTAGEAAKTNAEKTDKIIKILEKLIPEKKAVTTTGYNVYPEYQYDNQTNKSVFIGYKVSNQVNVKTIDMKNVGSIMDEVTNAGVTNINNLRFAYDKPEEIYQLALADAVDNALARAAVIAKRGSLTLKGIESAESMDAPSNEAIPMPMPVYDKIAGNVPTPVQPDSLKSRAMVKIVFKT